MTQNQSRNVTTNYQYNVNQASVNQVIGANATIASSMAQLSQMTAQNAVTAGAAGATIATTQARANAAAIQAAAAQKQLAVSYNQTASAASSAAVAQAAAANAGTGGRSVTGTLFNLRQAAIALPGVGYQSPLTVGIRALEIAADKTGASFAQLGIGMGLVGVALVGVGIAFSKFLEGITESKKVLDAALAAQQNYYDALREMTSAEVKARITELNRVRPILQQQIDETLSARDRAFAMEQQLPGGDITARALQAAGLSSSAQLQKDLDELNKQMGENEHTTTRLTQGYGSQVFAANDARAALEALTKAQMSEAKRAIDIDAMTREEREKQIAQNRRTIDILTQATRSSGITGDALTSLREQIKNLRMETEELEAVTTSYADLLAREKQIRESAKDTLAQINDFMQKEAEARQAMIDIAEKMADATADAESKRQDALDDANERRRNAETDAEEWGAEIVADAAERRQQIEQDDADRRAEILKQYNRSFDDAVANRDALSALKAKQTRDDELEKQQKAHDKQLEDLDKSLDKQLRAVDRALEKQLRSIQENYDRQQREIDQALARQRSALREAFAQAYTDQLNAQQNIATLQAAYNQMIRNAEVMHQAAMFKTIYDYGEMTRVYLDNLWRQIAGGAAGLSNGSFLSQMNNPNAVSVPAQISPTGFASGTPYVPRNGLYYLHRGERVVNAGDNQRGGGGGFTYAPTINGADMLQMVRSTNQVLERYLRKAGIA